DILLRYLLLFFTIYSLSVCPHDAELKSPICRGLSEYRRLILEPYISPAINKALSHPTIRPYVDRAVPYVNQAIQMARPVVLRTQLEWNHRITPQWNKVIVPQYHKYLTPRLQHTSAVVQPYLSAVEKKYESLLGPHVRILIGTLNKYHLAARPYVLIAADRTYSAYQTTRPYLHPVWQYIKHTLKQLLIFLRVQRRKFVDPHVARIWERVKELSRSDDDAITTQSPLLYSDYRIAVEKPTDSLLQSPSTTLAPTSSFPEVPAGSCSMPSVPTETPLISLPESKPLQSNPVTEEAASEAYPSGSNSLLESYSVTAPVGETTPSPTTAPSSTPATLPSPDDEDNDVDLEAFYAAIDFTHEESETEEPDGDVEDESPSLDEEQLEELRLRELAKTAEKRRDITSRHTKWEEQLDTVIKEKKKALRKALVALRKAAVQEFKTNTEVQSAVERLEKNAEKFLKGAEAYLDNLRKEPRATDEKVALWTKITAKVDTRFTEHLRHTEGVVNAWFTSHLERELQEVSRVAEEVREVADKAQADVGYDYIWLSDVTYHDWQRYHALVGKSNNFTELAKSIQNGSHPSPPINPLPSAMHELQLELQDVIAGFETRFRRVKRNGFKAFDSFLGDTMGEEETEQHIQPPQSPEMSILPIPASSSNLHTSVSGNESPAAGLPEVSILPIPVDETYHATRISESVFPAARRGKAEVEEAFERAKGVSYREPQQGAVENIASQATPVVIPPSESPLHAEL
ncbi:hypothetical protein F5148DRAFT_977358, partial [Russula earlei]